MKFKKLYSKILWRDSFTVALGFIASIETLFAITDFGLKDFTTINAWWQKSLIIIGVFLLVWGVTAYIKAFRANKEVVLTIRGIKVTITVGDIFKSVNWKLIPFNEFYDTQDSN